MKCIRCGTDSKYKDRTDRRCPGCHKHFAFEPQKGDLFTDAAFEAAIDAVSAKGRLRWGVEHLHYDLARRRRRRGPSAANVGFLLLGIVVGALVGIVTKSVFLSLIPGVAVALGGPVLIRRFDSPTMRLTTGEFNEMWKRWQAVHGAPKGVIVRKGETPAPRPAEPDLADYSFDRAVICDRARTADLLIANNFHFENNCAVLSVGGYPPGPFETIRAMLRRNPRLQAFTLHDATVPGCRLAHQLATSPEWFSGFGTVTDVGLRPRHAAPFRGLLLPLGAPVQPGDGIAPEESEWLSQHTLELAAIRPEQVLKRLFRAINRAREPEPERDESDDRDDPVDYDRESFSADAGDSDGGADAFG